MRHDLIARLKNPEDSLIERKPESFKNRELRKELVAFANSVPEGSEAVIFIGVSDDGVVLGIRNSDLRQKSIRRVAESECYPPIPVQMYVLDVEGKAVLAVVVSYCSNKPYFAGAAFVRRGSECVNASASEYENLINSRSDKCRAILNKKNELFTVIAQDKKLGSTERSPGTWYHECRVVECNQHSIRLCDIGRMQYFSESMEDVCLMYDEEKYRPKLVIRHPGA